MFAVLRQPYNRNYYTLLSAMAFSSRVAWISYPLFLKVASLFSFEGVIEKLHEAAYKNALSNSLYCPDFMVGRISTEQVWICFILFKLNCDLHHSMPLCKQMINMNVCAWWNGEKAVLGSWCVALTHFSCPFSSPVAPLLC